MGLKRRKMEEFACRDILGESECKRASSESLPAAETRRPFQPHGKSSFFLGHGGGSRLPNGGIASKLSAVCFTGCCRLFDYRLIASMDVEEKSRTPLD